MRVLLGHEGSSDRVIFVVGNTGFYLAVRPWRYHYRLGIRIIPWGFVIGRNRYHR